MSKNANILYILIFLLFNPSTHFHKLVKIFKNANLLYNMFSETSEHQLSNGVSHLILWQFWNFDFFPSPHTPLINWQKFTKMKKYGITCFQKPQNTSFPMVYHTWFYDDFEILIFCPLPPEFRQKLAKTQTYCIICFQKPQNTSFPMVYLNWRQNVIKNV